MAIDIFAHYTAISFVLILYPAMQTAHVIQIALHAAALQTVWPYICFPHDMLAVTFYVFNQQTSHVHGTHKTISIKLYACNQTYLVCGDLSFLNQEYNGYFCRIPKSSLLSF